LWCLSPFSAAFAGSRLNSFGSDRARPNEVGEIRRLLNSFLQFVEAGDSDSLILAATNQVEVLDPALFRRLEDA
jgi:ATP-dependent Zn protease